MFRNSVRARVVVIAAGLGAMAWLVPVSSAHGCDQDGKERGRGDFPAYRVPGQEEAMRRLRELHRLHYGPRTRTTLWDAWLPMASLWPAVGEAGTAGEMRRYYRDSLLEREIDEAGYVATQQHRGLAHAEGWPFPTWPQAGGAGWHFSMIGDGYAQSLGLKASESLEGWEAEGLEPLGIDPKAGARFRMTESRGTLTTPGFRAPAIVTPFVKVEWAAEDGVGAFLLWETDEAAGFGAAKNRVALPSGRGVVEGLRTEMARLDRMPGWGPDVVRLRLELEGTVGAEVVLKALHTAIDTRHPTNNSVYLQACADYFDWTGDVEFLRANLGRMRRALEFAIDEFSACENGCVVVPWTGHEGRSGIERGRGGRKQIKPGWGVGNNYWDLLPFGGQDALATIYLYAALLRMADLGREVAAHPEWGLGGAGHLSANELEELALSLKKRGGAKFWNAETGRFVGWIDVDGRAYDHGFTTLNEEAITYGFVTPEQARSIMDWMTGKRVVSGDTSTGADLYHWRFAPRATTKRNVETYAWVWSAPESLPWGGQVQDGGAVLGWSYFDLMARLEVEGPDNAWERLKEILTWFGEVQAEGGYRRYYEVPGRGTLQGGGPPGGLGMDAEFFESVLVPQVMLYGFLGVKPRPGGLEIRPKLPADWPSLEIAGIHAQGVVVDVTARRDGSIEVRKVGGNGPLKMWPGAGTWRVKRDGGALAESRVGKNESISSFEPWLKIELTPVSIETKSD